jgi:AcrR family transcriptional regulator
MLLGSVSNTPCIAPPGVIDGMPEQNQPSRRRAETRRRLIAVAYDVFAEHGIGDAPVELICERAGFSRGAFYSNFSSKEALFLAVYEEQTRIRLDRLQSAIDEVIDGSVGRDQESVREAVSRICELATAPLVDDGHWYQVCAEFRVQAMRQPDLRVQTGTAQEKFHRGLGEIVTEVLSRLDLTLTLSARDTVLVMVGLYEAALERAIFEGTDNLFISDVLPALMTSLITPALPAVQTIRK